MEGLGRTFNVVPVADAVEVSMKDCSAVTFICVGANAETFTLKECTDAAGSGAQNLVALDHYYACADSAGANAWTRQSMAAGAVVTTTTARPVAVIEVQATALSAGFKYLRVDSSSTGTVVALTHDLLVQRKPSNLRALAV